MFKHSLRSFALMLALASVWGCSAYQPTKNVWKTTKGLWNAYVSPAATVDYDEKGDLPPQARTLSLGMLGIDRELGRLERTMQNADKPPTREWLTNFLAAFPWVSGFAGVKYDGTILGQEPADSLKELDFNGLLYEDKKQNSRALRADVQPSPLGPEIMLAAPLYDGVDFLGIVVAYFDMRSLMQFAQNPEDMVILCPTALLWPGKYDFAATPLAGTNWSEVVAKSTAGSCTNSNGTFFYMVRFLGNLPLVFAVPEKGNFPEGDGNLEQGYAVFPAQREKMPPPPLPERKPESAGGYDSFARSEEQEEAEGAPAEESAEAAQPAPALERPAPERRRRDVNEIEPGARDSVLLKGGRVRQRQVQERALEGENITLEPAPQRRQAPARQEPALNLIPEEEAPRLPGGRPSPFGPREEIRRPSPFGPQSDAPAPESAPESASENAQEKAAGSVPESGATQEQSRTNAPADDEDYTERLADGEPAEPAEAAETPAAAPPAPAPAAKAGEAPSGKEDSSPQKSRENGEAKSEPARESGGDSGPRLLPGGRPSPFGPRTQD